MDYQAQTNTDTTRPAIVLQAKQARTEFSALRTQFVTMSSSALSGSQRALPQQKTLKTNTETVTTCETRSYCLRLHTWNSPELLRNTVEACRMGRQSHETTGIPHGNMTRRYCERLPTRQHNLSCLWDEVDHVWWRGG